MSIIQIKRRENAPSSISQLNNLMDGELGYIKATNQLYIGTGVGNNPVLINDIDPDTATKSYVDQKCSELTDTYLYTQTVTADGTSSVTFTVSNLDLTKCLIYCNGLLLIPNENYTISGSTINLVGWTAENGDYFSITYRTTTSSSGNDYAEYRLVDVKEPGRCVVEDESGIMKLSTERLQPGAEIISDTYGALIGRQNNNEIPIASSGRVLAYPAEDRNSYSLGCAVCSGPNGTVSQMTREEIREYPERIIGTVSEIPKYEFWGDKNIKVNNRIWIRIK